MWEGSRSRYFLAVNIIQATSSEEIARARALFQEYARSLNFSLCFQNFDKELANLPGEYSPPNGRLFLLSDDENVPACVALRDLGENTCEMKRLYVQPAFRGKGLGSYLITAIIAEAKNIGYERMRMDTVPSTMKEAVRLYRALGFKEIEPYRENPVEGALFMELVL